VVILCKPLFPANSSTAVPKAIAEPSSSLSSKYGLAADQTLEFGVITANRGSSGARLLKASPAENRDLYWALSAGGGGTYAVVYSLTAKAHPDLPVAAANFSFTPGNSQETLLAGIAAYHAGRPPSSTKAPPF